MVGVAVTPPETGRPNFNRVAPASFAAIDLGTNNCRLLVAAPTSAGFRVLDSFSRIVRLGEGLHGTGRLSPDAMERAIAALHAIASRLQRHSLRAIRAVATEACRQAANGSAFLERAHAETGLRFDLITTREEAELALESCAPLLVGPGVATARRALLFDIGGGSTELAWVRLGGPGEGRGAPELTRPELTRPELTRPELTRPELIGYDSLPIGVVTLSERYGAAAFTDAGFQAMVDEVKSRLRPFESIHCIGHETRLGGVRLLGTSGTVTTLAGVALNLARYRRPLVDGMVLAAGAAEDAVAALRRAGRAGLAAHPCVGPDRVDFVLPGCAVFEAIRQTWPMVEVTVADRGLREGMLLRLMRQARHRGRLPIRTHGH